MGPIKERETETASQRRLERVAFNQGDTQRALTGSAGRLNTFINRSSPVPVYLGHGESPLLLQSLGILLSTSVSSGEGRDLWTLLPSSFSRGLARLLLRCML